MEALLKTWAGEEVIIRFDQPPTGLSGPVPPGFDLTPEAFVHEFLAKLGVGPVAVIGNSSGGIFAYRYAASYPRDVTAVVLVNTPPSAPVDNAGALARQPWIEQLSVKTCAKYAKRRSLTCWRDFLKSMYVRKERVTDALVEQYYDYNRQPSAGQMTTIAAIMKIDAQVIDFLSKITAPTLVIWGTHSPVLPPDTHYDVLSLTSDQPHADAADLIVTTPGSNLQLPVPTLELSEVFDRDELVRKLAGMRFADHGPLAVTGESASMLVSLLDSERAIS